MTKREHKRFTDYFYCPLKGGEGKALNGFLIPMDGCQGREVKVLRCPAAVKGTKAYGDSEKIHSNTLTLNATVMGNTIMGRLASRKPKAGRPIQTRNFTNL